MNRELLLSESKAEGKKKKKKKKNMCMYREENAKK